jgi:hypothetical protein
MIGPHMALAIEAAPPHTSVVLKKSPESIDVLIDAHVWLRRQATQALASMPLRNLNDLPKTPDRQCKKQKKGPFGPRDYSR